MEKIELNFDSTLYQKELNQLLELGKKMTIVAKYIQEITKGKILEFDLEALNQWIKIEYNFLNVQQVMSLQNLEVKYNYVKDFLLKYDVKTLNQFKVDSKGSYKPITDVLSDVKKKYITYVSNDFIDDYKALLEAKKLLEKCNQSLLKLTVKKTLESVHIDLSNFGAIQNALAQNLV